MDETKSWFYSRSSSLDRSNHSNPGGIPAHGHTAKDFDDVSDSGNSSPINSFTSKITGSSLPSASSAETKRRRFFQRKNTSSAPASSNDSLDSSVLSGPNGALPSLGGLGSRAGSQESASGYFYRFILDQKCFRGQ